MVWHKVFRLCSILNLSLPLTLLTAISPGLAVPFNPPAQGNALEKQIQKLRQPGNLGYHVPPCVGTYQPLRDMTALVPDKTIGLTISDNPTFFIYVPADRDRYRPTSPKLAEFWLEDEQENLVYRARFELTGNPGIVRFQLPTAIATDPKEPPFRLEPNKTYTWRFAVLCDPDDFSRSPWAGGMVQRVAPTAELTKALQQASPQEYSAIYARFGIWYETLTDLAQQRHTYPHNVILKDNWVSLLKAVKLDDIIQAPLLPCCPNPVIQKDN